MRRFCSISLCVLVLLSLCLCGCGAKRDTDTAVEETSSSYAGFRNTVLYYETDEGLMAPVMRRIPWEEGIGRAALGYLVDSEENRSAIAPYGLRAPVPAGTEFSLRIGSDAHARVALANLPENMEKERAHRMVSAIVNTLTEFPSIERVSLSTDGAPIGEWAGEAALSESLSAMALNVEESSIPTGALESFAMTLYFPNSTGSLLVPVTRYVQERPDFTKAVQALLDGPQDGKLLACFPEGTALLDARIEDGAASVDLSADYAAVEETEGLSELGYESILLTAQAYGDIRSLDVLVEGEAYAMDAVSTLAPLYANEME